MNLQIREIIPEHYEGLCEFFRLMVESGSDKTFHPHPFDYESALCICNKTNHTTDLYYVMDLGFDRVIGYGILRGWDEGYNVPSLGIAIHPNFRGKGLSKVLMYFLHAAAAGRGSYKIRLKVYKDNTSAVKLYEKIGYKFQELNEKELLGIYDL